MDTSAGSKSWNQESGGNGAPLVDQAKQQAGQVMQQTRQAASRVADQAVQQVRTQIEVGKDRATGGLEEVSQALHETSESLRGHNQEIFGRYAESGAELVEQVSSYLRDRDVERIVDDVETFARRQTGLFLGGAFALGFILSRFFKSSSPNGSARRIYRETGGDGYAHASGEFMPTSTDYTTGAASTEMTSRSGAGSARTPITGDDTPTSNTAADVSGR